MCDGCVLGPHTFGSFGFDSNAIAGKGKQPGQISPDRFGMRADFRLRQNQRRINIDDFVARRLNSPQCLGQENRGVRALPLPVGGRKERSDIGRGDRSKQRISDCVQQGVTIGVSTQPFGVRNFDSADLQWDSAFEFVRVPAITDSDLRL